MKRPETSKEDWVAYCGRELQSTEAVLTGYGYELEREQPHISGERHLMSGRKIVLIGTHIETRERVIIKVSSDREGMREIEREKKCRDMLADIPFAYRALHTSKELLFTRRSSMVVLITSYIAQNKPFLTRPIEEQFSLALNAFKMQESVHATTSSHAALIRDVFGMWDAHSYLESFEQLKEMICGYYTETERLLDVLGHTKTTLFEHHIDIEQYCGFLTHGDFALHNVRISGDEVYLIDHSSLRFGNKHESWARFLNYLLLYNPNLEQYLLQYLHDNRTTEESQSLRLMRIYKLVELLQYHCKAWTHSSGTERELSDARIELWTTVLGVYLDEPNQQTASNAIYASGKLEIYKKMRDALRGDDEKKRQQELQQL